MKKIALYSLLLGSFANAQFKVEVATNTEFQPKEAYLYTLNGSKKILVSKEIKKNNKWEFSYPNYYSGAMKIYFPEANYTLDFISENKDVKLHLGGKDKKIETLNYLDEANKIMAETRDQQQKKDNILPVLLQMKGFYSPSSDFYKAMEKEISVLSLADKDLSQYPFTNFYAKNHRKYIANNEVSITEMTDFLSNSSDMLETSGLLQPLLLSYLRASGADMEKNLEQLFGKIEMESPRGQTILSELIEIFDTYSMKGLKDKYLKEAKGLKCTLNDRLSSTISTNDKLEIGSKIDDYQFHNPTNTKAKSIHNVKADKKILVFWSSTCSHCESQLPLFIPHYKDLKAKGIEIIGLSLDTDKALFEAKGKALPWINDTEYKGWYSSFVDKYNLHGTPSYIVLDKNNVIISKPDKADEVLEYLGVK